MVGKLKAKKKKTLREQVRDAVRTEARKVLEAKYRDETGVAALKIRHNGVLGYFIEVPARHADTLMAADSGFTHRQTMAGAVRFNAVALHEEASRIAEAGRLLGISVHDHIIIGRHGHVSLKAKGLS